MTKFEGGCRCRHIRYAVTGAPKFSFACHCTDCQTLSGSAYSLGLAMDESDFALESGDLHCWSKTGSSGKPSHQLTCPQCATWIATQPESAKGILILRPMSLDAHAWFRPVAEIFTRSALPWAAMPVLLTYEAEFEDPARLVAAYKASGIGPD